MVQAHKATAISTCRDIRSGASEAERSLKDSIIAAILEELRILHMPIDVQDKAALLQDVENAIALADEGTTQ